MIKKKAALYYDETMVILVACLFKKDQQYHAIENLCEQLAIFILSVIRYGCKSKLYIYTNNRGIIKSRLRQWNIRSTALEIFFLEVLSEKSAVDLMDGCKNQYTFAKIDALRALSLRHEVPRGVLISDIDTIIGPRYKCLGEYVTSTAINYYAEHNHTHREFAEALSLIAGDEIYNRDYWDSRRIRINSGYMYMGKEFYRFVIERCWNLCVNMHKSKELVEIKANHFGDELIFTVLYQVYDTQIMTNASKNCDAVIYWTCHLTHRSNLLLPPINRIRHIHLPAIKWQHRVRRVILRILCTKSIDNNWSWMMIYILLNLVTIYQQLTSEVRRLLVAGLKLKRLRTFAS